MITEIRRPLIGVCGLSCRLCPRHQTEAKSKCLGCKSDLRMAVGCPFITCAVKRKAIEFCWDCEEHHTCEKWRNHREYGKEHDTFKSYRKLEDNISSMLKGGVERFEDEQKKRDQLLREMLQDFNEGRSKNYYCLAATLLEIKEIRDALSEARAQSKGLEIKEKSKILHAVLDRTAQQKNYFLKLRK